MKGSLELFALGIGCMGMSHAYGRPADKWKMIVLTKTEFLAIDHHDQK